MSEILERDRRARIAGGCPLELADGVRDTAETVVDSTHRDRESEIGGRMRERHDDRALRRNEVTALKGSIQFAQRALHGGREMLRARCGLRCAPAR